MTTYLIKRTRTITRQAGDVADIVFTVPEVLSLVGKEVTFCIADSSKSTLITKSLNNGAIVVEQVITILLDPQDTTGLEGTYLWELQISDTDGPITIGRGEFIIIGEIIL